MSGSGTTPGATGYNTPGTPSSSMGTMEAQNAVHATVDDVNHLQNTVKLRMQDGKMVELMMPQQALASLSKGDSVRVSIHKDTEQQSRPSEPGSSPGSMGSTGTRSR
jgi:hypothetical protein